MGLKILVSLVRFQFWPLSVGALYVLLLFSLAGENGIPTELVISLNHPKQIFKNILEDCFGVSVPLNLR
jgi:hypothetical protein